MTYPKLSDLDISHPQVAMAVQAAQEWAGEKASGNEGISLILSGPNGVGKTHIAQAIWWSIRYRPVMDDWEDGETGHVITDGVTTSVESPLEVPVGRFFTAANLVVEMGPYIADNGMMHQPSPDYFVGDAPIVVIDDVGAKIVMPYIKGGMQAEEIQARYFLLVEHCMRRTREVRRPDPPDWGEVVSKFENYPPSLIITTNLDLGGGVESEFAQHVGLRVWDRLQEMCPRGFMVAMNDVPSWRVKESGR